MGLDVNTPATLHRHALKKKKRLTAMNKSEVSGLVFLDLKKVFDLADHDFLLKKLTVYLNKSCSLPLFKTIS